mmetsp:Transcript_50412/g.163315  ORF Transcript_50412/g.163315 Transcript_50412/m.163315 type:complete len:342 (+) Transcript_50412:483-1508(+)
MASELSRYRCCSAARRSGALIARRSSALRRHPPSSCSDSKARLARWNRNRSRGLETSRPPSPTCSGGPTCERLGYSWLGRRRRQRQRARPRWRLRSIWARSRDAVCWSSSRAVNSHNARGGQGRWERRGARKPLAVARAARICGGSWSATWASLRRRRSRIGWSSVRAFWRGLRPEWRRNRKRGRRRRRKRSALRAWTRRGGHSRRDTKQPGRSDGRRGARSCRSGQKRAGRRWRLRPICCWRVARARCRSPLVRESGQRRRRRQLYRCTVSSPPSLRTPLPPARSRSDWRAALRPPSRCCQRRCCRLPWRAPISRRTPACGSDTIARSRSSTSQTSRRAA